MPFRYRNLPHRDPIVDVRVPLLALPLRLPARTQTLEPFTGMGHRFLHVYGRGSK